MVRRDASLWRRRAAAFAVALGLAGAGSRTAGAAPPDPELLARLSVDEQELERLARRLSFRGQQVIQTIDGDGKVSSTRTTRYHVESDGKTPHEVVEKSVEDGKDVTADEQETARRQEVKRASHKPDDEPVWPFAPGSQARYTYDQVAVDPAHPTCVEIAFTPRDPSSRTFEGKAWVDTADARILTASVRLSKPPMLVDWVHLTAEFASTPAGPALRRMTFDAAGGLLFLHKHFRGEVTMSDWRVGP